MTQPPHTAYAPVNGVEMYYESRGAGGVPLVVVHGGFGMTTMFGGLLDTLAAQRRVVAVELQGHGHTRDIDRAFSFESFGDDIAALIAHLGVAEADLLGVSLGAGASLRCAIQHPARVRRLVAVSFPFRRDGWFPEVLVGMSHVGAGMFEQMRRSSMYEQWLEVAPDTGAFPALMDKTGALLARPYDWTEEISRLTPRTMLVYADADSIPPSHAAEFFALLGGGLRDAGWDGAGAGSARLSILAGLTHYDIADAPALAAAVSPFLA
jgi:pimeloyl-ACP methyl ester carboxylesterase